MDEIKTNQEEIKVLTFKKTKIMEEITAQTENFEIVETTIQRLEAQNLILTSQLKQSDQTNISKQQKAVLPPTKFHSQPKKGFK